jgi:hypothetical protein
MKNIAPEDSGMIDEFNRSIRKTQEVNMPVDKPFELLNVVDYLKLVQSLPAIPIMRKYATMPAEQFAKRLKNSVLRQVVSLSSSPILFEMFVLAEMNLKRSGGPLPGSLGFARLFEKNRLCVWQQDHLSTL